jgi:mannose-6-phosphate isomerase-like protein (cupin superfamily)
MASPGETIINPGTGEVMRFVKTAAVTGGECLEFELQLAPFGRVGGVPHKHEASERFTVHTGRLSGWIGLARRELGPGESLEVPAGVTHYVFNDSDEPVTATVEMRPARDFETFFETVFAIAARRRFEAFRGLPPPLQCALLAHTYKVYGPVVPILLQRPLLSVLAALARRRGYPEVVRPNSAPSFDCLPSEKRDAPVRI